MLRDRGVRADGSVRKPVKVRPGYVDPELAPKYQARGKVDAQRIPGLDEGPATTKAKSKPKKKIQTSQSTAPAATASSTSAPSDPSADLARMSIADPGLDTAKQARAIKKKLRQIEELEGKPDLTPEQQAKVARKAELEEELARLDAGEKAD